MWISSRRSREHGNLESCGLLFKAPLQARLVERPEVEPSHTDFEDFRGNVEEIASKIARSSCLSTILMTNMAVRAFFCKKSGRFGRVECR